MEMSNLELAIRGCFKMFAPIAGMFLILFIILVIITNNKKDKSWLRKLIDRYVNK